MNVSRTQFEFVMQELTAGRSVKDVAIAHLMSERQVQRIREAGNWGRWPYIVAKTRHGYNTPEYKKYLKRRGLPLTPPAKVTVGVLRRKTNGRPVFGIEVEKLQKKRPLLYRLLRIK
jgi:hypothetical protein